MPLAPICKVFETVPFDPKLRRNYASDAHVSYSPVLCTCYFRKSMCLLRPVNRFPSLFAT